VLGGWIRRRRLALEERFSGLVRRLEDGEGEWEGWYWVEGFENGGYWG
jgi:hypothetical protein